MGLLSNFALTKLRLCLTSVAGICRKMWIRNSVQPAITSCIRSKRALILCLVVTVVILYLFSSYLKGGTPKFLNRGLARCMKDRLYLFENQIQQSDALISRHPPEDGHRFYLPYVGNGHLGVAQNSDKGLYLRLSSSLSLPVNYYPVVKFTVDSRSKEGATVTDFITATVHDLKCFQVHSNCIAVTSQLYAHRTRPSLLVQQVKVHNPTNTDGTVDVTQIGLSDWTGAKTTLQSLVSKSSEKVEVSVSVGVVGEPGKADSNTVVAIASTKLPKTITVKGGRSTKVTIITGVEYTSSVKQKSVEEAKISLKEKVLKTMKSALLVDEHKLKEEHTRVWSDLWRSGVSISLSKAPGAINGVHINSTIYYVLSNTRSPIHEVDVQPATKANLAQLLTYPDRCYDARHHTLQVPVLWDSGKTEGSVADLASRWLVTLEKQGCKSLVEAGADGVLQGIVLSVGGFQFKNYHLEFNTHPKDLHRDFTFRRISYGNNTHVNVSVAVRQDNRAVLYVALDRKDKPYYACDAGCIDPPVKLSEKKVSLPVKLTEPLTAILYITSDQEHMSQLKNVLHVHRLEEAPAHEDHVMALHRHGHRYGGLPTIFWVSVVLLVVVFHLFLFKMIYNEYCSGNQSSRTGKYNL